MSGRRNFRELREKIRSDPERAARIAHVKAAYDAIERLAQVRQARGMTQEQVASALSVSQENVSRIERQDDLHVSTVVRYVSALGGRIVLEAVFEDDQERVDLTQLIALRSKDVGDSESYQA